MSKVEQDMSFLDHLEELRWRIVKSVIAILVLIDIVQSKFQKKLLAQKNQSATPDPQPKEPSTEPVQP